MPSILRDGFNADLLRGAVKCIRLNTDLRCKIYVGVERKKLNIDGVTELGCAPGGNGLVGLRSISANFRRKIILLLKTTSFAVLMKTS